MNSTQSQIEVEVSIKVLQLWVVLKTFLEGVHTLRVIQVEFELNTFSKYEKTIPSFG